MRTFLALPCPDRVHEELAALRDELEEAVPLRPVPRENFHVTVKFLGEVTASRVEDLDALLQRRLPTPGPLSVRLEGVGAFPDPSRPRVVWAGIRPTEPLRDLGGAVEELTVEMGWDARRHDFHPHVTLGRVDGDLSDPAGLVDRIQTHGEAVFGSFEAPKLHLFESDRTGDAPPEYRSLMSWPL